MGVVNELNDDNIKELAEKHLNFIKTQRERAYAYYLKMKGDPDFLEKERLRKKDYYIKNREKIMSRDKLKYNSDQEYHDRVRESARNRYRLKTQDIPKLKRGRKPKNKLDKPSEEPQTLN